MTSTASGAPTRVAGITAAAEGAAAAKVGVPVAACPYPATGNLTDRFKRRYWLRGHTGEDAKGQPDGQEPSARP